MFGMTKVIDQLLSDLRLERERVDRLVAELASLKREGFVTPPTASGPPPQLPDVIRLALAEIPEKARPDTERWAWAHLGEDPDVIAAQILDGA